MLSYYHTFLKLGSNKIVTNIIWLFLDKGLRMGLGLVIGVWVARYLGPELFGKLNYGQAFIAIFASIVNLGLDTTLVKEFVSKPASKKELIGTSFFLRLSCASIAIIFAISTAYFLEYDQDQLSFYIIAILSIGLIFQPVDIVDLYLQSQLRSKITVIIKNIAYTFSSAFKIYLLIFEYPLIYFALATVIELGVAALIVIIYSDKKLSIKIFNWSFDKSIATSLLKTSWPLIISALAVILYMRMDQVMLKHILNSTSVGNYSASVRVTEILYIIPVIISNSLFPSLVQSSQEQDLYQKKLIKLYAILIYISIGMSLFITLSSPYIISFLYGAQYKEAVSILNVHVWSSMFVFIGVASSQQLVIEGKVKITLYRTLIGVATNFSLNLILIPTYGAQGAAMATLVSYAASSFLSNYLFKSTREINNIYFRSVFFFRELNRI